MSNQKKIETAIYQLLTALGEDPTREGLLDTPKRVAKMYKEMLSGLQKDPKDELTSVFLENHEEIILLKDIPFYSICEHHIVPFYGVAHVAYIPSKEGKVTGLSKLARVVEITSKRLQLQERLTNQVVKALDAALKPKGALAMVEAEHLCMTMRGIKKPGSRTVTIVATGLFDEDINQRQEILSMIHNK